MGEYTDGEKRVSSVLSVFFKNFLVFSRQLVCLESVKKLYIFILTVYHSENRAAYYADYGKSTGKSVKDRGLFSFLFLLRPDAK